MNLSRGFECVEKVGRKRNATRKKKDTQSVEDVEKIKVCNTKRTRADLNEEVECSARKRKKVNAAKHDHPACKFCGKRYNTKEGDKPEDDWLQCATCKEWVHETCAEQAGVIGDDDFIRWVCA